MSRGEIQGQKGSKARQGRGGYRGNGGSRYDVVNRNREGEKN